MINRAAILQWRTQAPWNTGEQVEQDLIISRALIAIFSDEFLASQLTFRGGTALHKLYLSPQSRYSEDMDGLIRPDEAYNIEEAYQIVKEKIIDRL